VPEIMQPIDEAETGEGTELIRPKILTVAVGFNASSGPLIKQPLDLLQADGLIGHRFRLSGRVDWDDIRWADILIFQNSQENIDIRVLRAAQAGHKRVIFHTDDNYLAIPRDMMKTRHFHYPHRLANYRTFLREADLAVAATPVLAEALSAECGRPVIAPAKLPAYARLIDAPPRGSQDGTIRFYYAASEVNFRYFEEIAGPAVRQVMAEYGPRVHFTFVGGRIEGLNPALCEFLPRQDLNQYLETLVGLTLDVGLAPVADLDYSRYKSDLKYREYGARGLAGIYSHIPLYRSSVDHGRTGFLAVNSREAWYEAIKGLIEDPGAASRIGQAARNEIAANNAPEKYAQFWREIIDRFEPSPPARPGLAPAAPAAYQLHRSADRLWREIRTAWYDIFYLGRSPLASLRRRRT